VRVVDRANRILFGKVPMKRLASVLVLALAVALPGAAFAKKAPPTPGALSTATMPACAAGDPVVWVNTSSKVYHAQGTPWFGRTAHGVYACTSAAVAMGAKPAGMRGASKKSPPTPSSAMPSPNPKKKKHKGGEMMPAATPTP
jgi:hypothetical protein